MKRYLILFLLIIGTFSCKQHPEKETESGLRYTIYGTPGTGKKIELSDYVSLVMTYKDDRDSVLYDSRTTGEILRFPLEKIPFKGSFEEGLTLLSSGDSATFYISADSMYKYLFKNRGNIVPQEQTAFRKNSFVRFDVRILGVQNPLQAEMEMEMRMSEEEKKERADIKKYITENNITIAPDSSGIYLIMKEKGNGMQIDSGKLVTLEYEGRFLDNTVFDGTKKAGHPYRFMSGAHHVIPGWEKVMRKMNEGDRFTLILPSAFGYGKEGIRNAMGKYIVPPNKPLVFDISIIKVEDMPSVSGR